MSPQRFRKKQVEIEAMQFVSWEDALSVIDWAGGTVGPHKGDPMPERPSMLVIQTLEGQMIAHPGDWIIRGVRGEFYPVKPDIFEETYEPVAASA